MFGVEHKGRGKRLAEFANLALEFVKLERSNVAEPACGGQLLQTRRQFISSDVAGRSWAIQLIGTISCPPGAMPIGLCVPSHDESYGADGCEQSEGDTQILWRKVEPCLGFHSMKFLLAFLAVVSLALAGCATTDSYGTGTGAEGSTR